MNSFGSGVIPRSNLPLSTTVALVKIVSSSALAFYISNRAIALLNLSQDIFAGVLRGEKPLAMVRENTCDEGVPTVILSTFYEEISC